MRDTSGEVKTNSYTTFSCEPLHTNVQVFDDQLELIYNSSVRTLGVVWNTYRKRWMIETNGEREPGKFMLAARHDDDDNDLPKPSIQVG